MPKPITVVVAGATGKQGGAVARVLLERGHRVRGLTRRPESTAAAALKALGAAICEADLDDGETLLPALEGADAFFLLATPFEDGIDAEILQGCTGARAARDAGVKHLVYSSVAAADQGTGVPHFDSKAQVEAYIQKLGVPWTVVGPAFFMENLLGPACLRELRTGNLSLPLPPDRSLQMVAVEDIAGFVRLVVERPGEFAGRRIDIASDSLTGSVMAGVLSKISGETIDYREAPLAPVRAASTDLALMWEWLARVGHTIDIARLVRSYPDVGWHTFAGWTAEQDLSVLDDAGPEQPTA